MQCEGLTKICWKVNMIIINAVRSTIFWFSPKLVKWLIFHGPHVVRWYSINLSWSMILWKEVMCGISGVELLIISEKPFRALISLWYCEQLHLRRVCSIKLSPYMPMMNRTLHLPMLGLAWSWNKSMLFKPLRFGSC